MTDVPNITIDRLKRWGADCIRDHATPGLLLAIGHDHRSGEVHVYVPDDPFFDREVICNMLALAITQLSQPEEPE